MNKKGIELSAGFIIALIVVLITFAIIWGWLVRTGIILDKEADKNACKLTLSIQEQTKIGVGEHFYIDSPFKLQCKRSFFHIGEEKITLDLGVRDRVIASYQQPSDAVVGKFVADRLANCWDTALEGKQPIFNDRGFLTSRSTICLICDQIDVNVRQPYLGNGKFPAYLTQTEMPGRGITYEEYLFTPVPVEIDKEATFTSGQAECMARNNIPNDITIETGTYATIVYRDFGAWRSSCMGTYIVPAEQLSTLCDYVAN